MRAGRNHGRDGAAPSFSGLGGLPAIAFDTVIRGRPGADEKMLVFEAELSSNFLCPLIPTRMWQFIHDNPFIIGALTGSLASYLLGLLVSYFRREKTWLGYSLSSRNIVLKGHTQLSMKYGEREISRLDSHTIVLRNIGNRPLKNLPVRIESEKGGIVEHELKPPDGAEFTAALEGERLTVTCDLLNPGEAATIGLTVADSADGDVKVIARAESLVVKELGQQLDTDELLDTLATPFLITRLSLDLFRFLVKATRGK